MSKITFTKLCSQFNLKTRADTCNLTVGDKAILEVRQYLPINEKTEFLHFIVDNAIDYNTGCFSPLRVEVYFGLAIAKWYGGVSFTDKQIENAGKTYDVLDSNNLINDILDCLPREEKNFITDLVNDTIKDIARYNNSAAGIIKAMSENAGQMDLKIDDILNKVKNAEGIENLKAITDVVGTD